MKNQNIRIVDGGSFDGSWSCGKQQDETYKPDTPWNCMELGGTSWAWISLWDLTGQRQSSHGSWLRRAVRKKGLLFVLWFPTQTLCEDIAHSFIYFCCSPELIVGFTLWKRNKQTNKNKTPQQPFSFIMQKKKNSSRMHVPIKLECLLLAHLFLQLWEEFFFFLIFPNLVLSGKADNISL